MVIYSVIHKSVFTPLRDLPTRIIEAIDHSWNSTMAFAFTKNPRIFCKCKCHCWVCQKGNTTIFCCQKGNTTIFFYFALFRQCERKLGQDPSRCVVYHRLIVCNKQYSMPKLLTRKLTAGFCSSKLTDNVCPTYINIDFKTDQVNVMWAWTSKLVTCSRPEFYHVYKMNFNL